MVASAVAAVGIGASLYSSSRASSAATEASGQQAEAARIAAELGREGLGFQQEMFDTSRADLSPYRATGGAALHTMSNMFLPGGQGMVQMQGQLNELRAQRAAMMGQEQRGAVSPVQQAAAAPGGSLPGDPAGTARSSTGTLFDPVGLTTIGPRGAGMPVNRLGEGRERATSA